LRAVTAFGHALTGRGSWVAGGLLALGCGTASVLAAPGLQGMLGAMLALVMLAIAATDARRFIIPDALNLLAVVLGAIHAGVAPDGSLEDVAIAGVRGVALGLSFWILRELYRRLRGREGLGFGDVKLAAAAGVWLEASMIPVAIEIAALSALAAYGLRSWWSRRPVRARTRLPFGLFLAPAIWLAWLVQTLISAS
jgi:leader peptidase (prepilin peptidase)/N-methyltransferase